MCLIYVPNLSVRVCVHDHSKGLYVCIFACVRIWLCVCVISMCDRLAKKLKERWKKKKKKKEEEGERRNKRKEQEQVLIIG